ncbi:hypothetical protein [Paenibacillus sp. PK1-4R]|uniref:hypothetical protein n=1 Tax=Paenibacillus sp. PK1-4R TaxID=3049075 RepID=UPI0025A083EF|nr:hypothetical protein [Paenibacillus sp. PK1-4R]WJM05880.1 hypothetical protein QNO02_16490 [Paenibacillus sp. PK1-4R]
MGQSKSEYKRIKKILQQGKRGLRKISGVLSIASMGLSFWAREVFAENPHPWYDITGRMDIMLIGFALLLSLMNIYISATLRFIDVYIGDGYLGKYGKLKMMKTLGSMFIPFVFAIHSLVTLHPLYLIPVAAVTVTHVIHSRRASRSN